MNKLKSQIAKNFEIKDDLIQRVNNDDELLHLLSLFVQELVNKDFEKLLFLLYKIDIGEKKVKKAILESSPEEAHIVLAKLIVEREKEKLETREKYKRSEGNNEWVF